MCSLTIQVLSWFWNVWYHFDLFRNHLLGKFGILADFMFHNLEKREIQFEIDRIARFRTRSWFGSFFFVCVCIMCIGSFLECVRITQVQITPWDVERHRHLFGRWAECYTYSYRLFVFHQNQSCDFMKSFFLFFFLNMKY